MTFIWNPFSAIVSETCANMQLERLSQDTLALYKIKYLAKDHFPQSVTRSHIILTPVSHPVTHHTDTSYWHNDHLHAGGARGVSGGKAHQHRREGLLRHDQPPRYADWEWAGERDHSVQVIWVWSEGRHNTPVCESSVSQRRLILIYLIEDLSKALTMLGLNPTEQETVDIPNQIARFHSLSSTLFNCPGSLLGMGWFIFLISANYVLKNSEKVRKSKRSSLALLLRLLTDILNWIDFSKHAVVMRDRAIPTGFPSEEVQTSQEFYYKVRLSAHHEKPPGSRIRRGNVSNVSSI